MNKRQIDLTIKRHLIAPLLLLMPLLGCTTMGVADYKTGMMYHDMHLYLPARNSFKIAAHEGNPEAKNMMGWYWANGLGHLDKNIVNACNWYAEAANDGLSDAIYNFGACYEYPGFAQRDINRAIALYTLAARKGNPKAQETLIRLGQPVPAADLAPPPKSKPTAQPVTANSPPAKQTPPQIIRTATQAPAAQPAASYTSSSVGAGAADLLLALLSVFAASKGYGSAPEPVFFPPRAISVHCSSQTSIVGQTGITNTNCY